MPVHSDTRQQDSSVSSSRLVLALTGPVGSGVTTISRILEQQKFKRITLSAAIKEEYRKRHGIESQLPFKHADNPDWRKELQDIGDEKRKDDAEYWVKVALDSESTETTQPLVIDGVRNTSEIRALRNQFSNCYIVAVLASKDTRWSRVQNDYDKDFRAFERDEQRDADEEISYGQQVEKCVQLADYVLWNEQVLPSSGCS